MEKQRFVWLVEQTVACFKIQTHAYPLTVVCLGPTNQEQKQVCRPQLVAFVTEAGLHVWLTLNQGSLQKKEYQNTKHSAVMDTIHSCESPRDQIQGGIAI